MSGMRHGPLLGFPLSLIALFAREVVASGVQPVLAHLQTQYGEKLFTNVVALQRAAPRPSRKMSTSPEPGPPNGHVSPPADDSIAYVNGNQSDSDLSDVQAADIDEPTPDSIDHPDSFNEVKADDDSREPSEPSDNDISDDADFDGAESLASGQSQSDHDHDEPGSSDDSQRAPKRKAGPVLDDDFIRNDPELYGLRRSVRYFRPNLSACHV